MGWREVNLNIELPPEFQAAVNNFNSATSITSSAIQTTVDSLKNILEIIKNLAGQATNIFTLFETIAEEFRQNVNDLFDSGMALGVFHNFNASEARIELVLPAELNLFYWDDDLKKSIPMPEIKLPKLNPIKAIESFEKSLSNTKDTLRPKISETQYWACCGFLLSAGTLPELLELLNAFNAIMDFKEIRQFKTNVEKRLEALKKDYEKFFSEEIRTNPERREQLEKYLKDLKEQPEIILQKNWVSLMLEDFLPGLEEIKIRANQVIDYLLNISKESRNTITDLVEVIDKKIDQITNLLNELNNTLNTVISIPPVGIDGFADTGVGLSSLKGSIRKYPTRKIILGKDINMEKSDFTIMIIAIAYGANPQNIEAVKKLTQLVLPDIYNTISWP